MKTKKRQLDFDEICHFTQKQKEASRAVKEKKFILYAGAMGTGKSYFLRWKLLRMLLAFHARGIDNVMVVLFCEDYPALRDRHLAAIKYEFPAWLGDYKEADHNFVLKERFGSGILAFRNLDVVSKYQSTQFAVIAVDELTKNSEDTFMFLRTRLRWPGIADTRFIAATNPGGVGHFWVKQRWITGVHPDNEKEADQFQCIRADAGDNPYIDESYWEKTLGSLPPQKQKAYREGSWDLFEGQFFTDWDPKVHVVRPIEIPYSWHRYRSIDVSGMHGTTSCHWYAVDNGGNVWVYREYYALERNADEHARHIAALSHDEEYRYTVIDNSAMAMQGLGETLAQVYERYGVRGLMPSPKGSRVAGWDAVGRYLRHDDKTPPKLRVFDTCTNMIRTLPSLVHDEKHPDDIDTNGDDHAADELRYLLQTLRDHRAAPPMSAIEKRLMQMRRKLHPFDYSYRR